MNKKKVPSDSILRKERDIILKEFKKMLSEYTKRNNAYLLPYFKHTEGKKSKFDLAIIYDKMMR